MKKYFDMYRARIYKPTDKMSDLICENYTLLQVLSRFGISLGFGDKNVSDVCKDNNVDCKTFLAVVNFLIENSSRMLDHLQDISIPALISYLKQSHEYFLDFQLPSIRRKLVEALDNTSEKDASFLILQFFDAYVNEVRKHMEYENEKVFVYVNRLLKGEASKEFNISVFARNHDHIDTKLKELKNIIIKYFPAGCDNFLLNATLFDIFSCEDDLSSHNNVEDFLFIPAIKELENRR